MYGNLCYYYMNSMANTFHLIKRTKLITSIKERGSSIFYFLGEYSDLFAQLQYSLSEH